MQEPTTVSENFHPSPQSFSIIAERTVFHLHESGKLNWQQRTVFILIVPSCGCQTVESFLKLGSCSKRGACCLEHTSLALIQLSETLLQFPGVDKKKPWY